MIKDALFVCKYAFSGEFSVPCKVDTFRKVILDINSSIPNPNTDEYDELVSEFVKFDDKKYEACSGYSLKRFSYQNGDEDVYFYYGLDLLDNKEDFSTLIKIVEKYSPESLAEAISYACCVKGNLVKSVNISNELNSFNTGVKKGR